MENQFSQHLGFSGRKPVPASIHGKHCECLKVEISLKKATDKGGSLGLPSPALETLLYNLAKGDDKSERLLAAPCCSRFIAQVAWAETLSQPFYTTGIINLESPPFWMGSILIVY